MNSPRIIISHYKSIDRSMSLCEGQGSPMCASWLLTPGPHSRSFNEPQCLQFSKTEYPPVQATRDEVNSVMDKYWDEVFEFTYPEAVDFQDLSAGELACTARSTMVAEHGSQLMDLVASLQAMQVEPEHATMLSGSIAKVKGSLEGLKHWLEEQREMQLDEEKSRKQAVEC